ncbi:hypothetical protein KO561_15830 [Radiobacillus kanasensis]|uniref:hypothetical protein n=1 Tax=Radiobacillus kanasensis TaxID=2844358 RepID=UPI001E3E8852|nr:hypothetical protein [Radiobacillus kanasensis]UFT98649.1 hypothetical protein KO561_15830 [Radiobacillus kanasensis]
MKRKKIPFYFLIMCIVVLFYLCFAIFIFLQPEYTNQPSMPNMLSRAMILVLQQTRRQDLYLTPMMEACADLCKNMDAWMPQHGNPVLDVTNYVLSFMLIICIALLVGWVIVFVLLSPLKQRSKKKTTKEKKLLRKQLIIFLSIIIFAVLWLIVMVEQNPNVLQMGLYFWIYSFFAFLIVVVLVVLIIGSISQLYEFLKNQWFPKKRAK